MAQHPSDTIHTGPSQRQLRVGEEIRHILSQVLVREDLYVEILTRHSLSVTEVQMSPDLKHARVFIMTLGGKELKEVVAALNSQAKVLRAAVARQMEIRFMPKLVFKPDLSYAASERINELLHTPHVARDLVPKDGDNEPQSS